MIVLRGHRIGGENRSGDTGGDVAVGGERRVVNLNRLAGIDERSAVGHGHREGGAGDRADRAEHAVAGSLHQLVEERAKLLHALRDFALGGVFDGALAAGGHVFDELGDFDREAEENR